MIRCPLFFGGHFMHQSTALQKAHGNSRLLFTVSLCVLWKSYVAL